MKYLLLGALAAAVYVAYAVIKDDWYENGQE